MRPIESQRTRSKRMVEKVNTMPNQGFKYSTEDKNKKDKCCLKPNRSWQDCLTPVSNFGSTHTTPLYTFSDTKWYKFLDLANTPRGQLSELIKSSKVDMGCGLSVEELLPSVEYARDTIRFLLYHTTLRDSEGYGAKKNDTSIRGYRKIHLANLEAFIDPGWKQKLPYFISRDLTVVSQMALEAAKAFLGWCGMPNGEGTRFVRRCWKYFVLSKDHNRYCYDK